MRRAATRRAGVLAYTPRSREYIRRVLRALGHSPLVFTNIDEFMAFGSGASTLDLMVLGDAPDTDSQGRAVVACALDAIGPDVPMLQVPMHKGGRPIRRRADARGAVVASPHFFSDLFRVILGFLDSLGFTSTPHLLVWDRYAFHPIERTVSFGAEQLTLDPVDLDVALELFYSAGRPVARRWLTRMLPTGEHGANWHRIDNLACTIDEIRVALQLDGAHGWTLEALPGDAYRLASPPRRAAHPSLVRVPVEASPERLRGTAPMPEPG